MANDIKLTPTQQLVLNALLERANFKTWETFVGAKTIARMTGIALSTVKDALKDLNKKGVILKACERPTEHGFVNVWRIAEGFREKPQQGLGKGSNQGADTDFAPPPSTPSAPPVPPPVGGGEIRPDLVWIKTLIENLIQPLIENQQLLAEKLDLLLIRTQHLNPRSDPFHRPQAESPSSAAPPCANFGCKNPAKPDTGYCSYECEQEDAELDEVGLAEKAGNL